MRVLDIILFGAMLLCSMSALAVPKAAIVFSSWGGNAFINEYDDAMKSIGWGYEKYENVKLTELVRRLSEYDVVISSSTGNFEHIQDMGPYKEQWLSFLNKGGVLLVVDANYDSVLGSWVNKLGEDFKLTSSGCAPFTHKNGGSGEVKFESKSPLLTAPYDIKADFARRGGNWAHLESWPAGWINLITCADGKSHFLYRRVGKGLVAVISYASYKGDEGSSLSAKLLNNLLMFTQSSSSGIEVVSSSFPEAIPGVHVGNIVVHNTSDKSRTITVQLSSEPAGAVAGGQPKPVRVEPGKTANIPFDMKIISRGGIVLTADILADGQTPINLVRKINVPEMMAFKVKNRHQFNASSVAFDCMLAPDANISLKDSTLEIDVDGKNVRSVKSPNNRDAYTLKTSGLKYGLHKAEARLMYNGTAVARMTSEFVLNPAAKIHSRADGTLIINGKPEFPFGWYHVSWGTSLQDRLDFIKSIGEAGFNVAHMSCDKPEDWKTVLDAADKVGVKVITEYGGDYPAFIKAYKYHPAVMAWNSGDEPDGQGISPDEMLRRANSFKDADPDHPAYMVLCVPPTYARYAGSADIIAPDIYPIPNGKVEDVYKFLMSARTEAAKYSRPIWAVVQCFGYASPKTWRIPTVDECRNMTYQALLAGAKGVIYYTYYDGQFAVQKFPDLWKGMKELVPEINAVKPYVLSGMPEAVKSGSEDIVCGIWKSKNGHLLMITNTSSKETMEVKIALQAGLKKSWKALFARDSEGLTVIGNVLSGKLRPLGAAVFKD